MGKGIETVKDGWRNLRAAGRLVTTLAWLAASAYVACVLLVGLFPFRRRLGPATMQMSCRGLMWIWGVRLTMAGRSVRCPLGDRPVLILANHCSFFDIIVLAAVFRTVFVSKDEVLFWPMLGIWGWLAGVIYLDRSRMRSRLQVLRQLARSARPGGVFAVFPQGTIASNHHQLPFQRGIFKLVELNPSIWLLPVTLDYHHHDTLVWNNEPLLVNALRAAALPAQPVRVHAHGFVTIADYRRSSAARVSRAVERTVLDPLRPAALH